MHPRPPQDQGTAKKLAFHKDVHARCVTLEGDDFNPSGLLTGAAICGGSDTGRAEAPRRAAAHGYLPAGHLGDVL